MSSFVDTHCHLDKFEDSAKTIDDAKSTLVVAVTELPSQYRLLSAQFRGEGRVALAVGLHPLRAATAGAFEEGLLIRELEGTDYVGEIGLDFSRAGRES